jgi:arylsulfatase A-like enzyme
MGAFAGCADSAPADGAAEDGTNTVARPYALVIGVDGVRADALVAADTPNLDRIRDAGAWSMSAQTQQEAATNSGPGWASILTGVDADKHNIWENDQYDGQDPDYPSFLWRARDAGLRTMTSINWIPLSTAIVEDDAVDERVLGTDTHVTDELAARLTAGDYDVHFIHFDDVDHAGHASGFNPDNDAYTDAIEVVDRQVGQLLDAIEARASWADESWLIAMTSDHGGTDAGHGCLTWECRTVPLILSGPAFERGELLEAGSHMDVHPTVLQHMGLTPSQDWDLDGAVQGLPQGTESGGAE